MGSNGLPVYGDRLDGIDAVAITDEQKTNLVKKIKENNNVITVRDPHLSGRTYNVTIIVADSMNRDEAKGLANLVTESLNADQNNYYDVQVFINKKYNCTLVATDYADEEGIVRFLPVYYTITVKRGLILLLPEWMQLVALP